MQKWGGLVKIQKWWQFLMVVKYDYGLYQMKESKPILVRIRNDKSGYAPQIEGFLSSTESFSEFLCSEVGQLYKRE